jgi:hypothetical protein
MRLSTAPAGGRPSRPFGALAAGFVLAVLSLILSGGRLRAAETNWSVGETGLQVQNTDPEAASEVRARFFDLVGRLTYDLPRPVAAGGATNFYLPQIERDAGLIPQSYSLIITSDRGMAAISRTEDRQSGSALLYTNVDPATSVSVPLVMKAFAGQNTLLTVQNTDPDTATTLRVRVFRSGESQPAKDLSIPLAAAASLYLDVGGGPQLADLPAGFLGWMLLTSDTPVTAQASVHMVTSDRAVGAFEGQPSDRAAARLLVPLVRRDWFGTTGVAVVNPSTSTGVVVTATYRGVLGACAGRTFTQGPVALGPAVTAVFYQGDGVVPITGASPLPSPCAGTAELSATGGGVLATVIDTDKVGAPTVAAAYNALATDRAARRLAMPLIRNHHTPADLVTGILVQNAAAEASTTVRLRFFDAAGNPLPGDPAHTALLEPGAAGMWYLPQVPVVGAQPGLYGSALLDGDGPVVAVVSEVSLNGRSDTAAYTAIPVVDPVEGMAAPAPPAFLSSPPRRLPKPDGAQP